MKNRNQFIRPSSKMYRERRAMLDVRIDTVMKYLFFSGTPESNELLKHLITTFVRIDDIQSVKKMNENEFNQNGIAQQMSLDGVCRVNDLHIVAVEMQKDPKVTDFDRFTRYGAGLIEFRAQCRELFEGGMNLVLVFLGYPIPKDFRNEYSDYINPRSDQGGDVSKLFLMQVEELARSALAHLLKLPVDQISSKQRYLLWMCYGHEEKYWEKMKAIIEMEVGLQMAEAEIVNIANNDVRWMRIQRRMEEDIRENEKIYHDKLLAKKEKECELAHQRANEMEQKVGQAEQRANEMEQKVGQAEQREKQKQMEIERIAKEKEEERKKRKQVEQQLLEIKVEFLLSQGYTYEETCKQCNITMEQLEKCVHKDKKHNIDQ